MTQQINRKFVIDLVEAAVIDLLEILLDSSCLENWSGTLHVLLDNFISFHGRCSGLMVSALVSRSSGPGSSPGRGHCVVFLGKTLYLHSASLHPGV